MNTSNIFKLLPLHIKDVIIDFIVDEVENRKNMNIEFRKTMIERAKSSWCDDREEISCSSCGIHFGEQQLHIDIFNPHCGVYVCLDCIQENPVCCCEGDPECLLSAIALAGHLHFRDEEDFIGEDWGDDFELDEEGYKLLLPIIMKLKEMEIDYEYYKDEDKWLNDYAIKYKGL